jgi:hypothetical protein
VCVCVCVFVCSFVCLFVFVCLYIYIAKIRTVLITMMSQRTKEVPSCESNFFLI